MIKDYSNDASPLVAEQNVDMEILVDDFVTFYVAGGYYPCLHVQASSDHVIQPSGQETTSNALLFAIILIHQHPEVLDRYFVLMCACVHVSVLCAFVLISLIIKLKYQSMHRIQYCVILWAVTV